MSVIFTSSIERNICEPWRFTIVENQKLKGRKIIESKRTSDNTTGDVSHNGLGVGRANASTPNTKLPRTRIEDYHRISIQWKEAPERIAPHRKRREQRAGRTATDTPLKTVISPPTTLVTTDRPETTRAGRSSTWSHCAARLFLIDSSTCMLREGRTNTETEANFSLSVGLIVRKLRSTVCPVISWCSS